MTPLPEHENDKEIIGDLVKALLEELDIEFRALGSTTFKNQAMTKGIEPDQCFYIEHERSIRGKKNVDLTVDLPPDLALEVDITSRTHLRPVQPFQVFPSRMLFRDISSKVERKAVTRSCKPFGSGSKHKYKDEVSLGCCNVNTLASFAGSLARLLSGTIVARTIWP